MKRTPSARTVLAEASDKEYDSGEFDIVSIQESENLLDFYGGSKNFKDECQKIISIIREQRGRTSLFEEDLLP